MAERAVARVDLGAVERNCARLRSELPADGRLCAVVKAGGYGHGATECARAALRGGAGWLAVATAEEAADLRTAGLDGPLLVMGALTPAELEAAAGARADVVAWTRELVDAAAALGTEDEPVRVHVKLDTGMGRLGTADPGEASELCRRVEEAPGAELVGLMTHFATADERDDAHFPAQLRAFEDWVGAMRPRHPGAIAHAANSAAVLREPASHFDMARCGIAVYGLDPFHVDPAASSLDPALELASWVAAVKRFEPGRSAGYGRRWTAAAATWVGTLPIGYGDGVRRVLTNNCDVLVGGRRVPLVGTVSMDNVTVDLGPGDPPPVGTEAILIGRQGEERILCEEVAARAATINYEITCGLSQRVPRRHRG